MEGLTPLAVCCIIEEMEQTDWTEQQVVVFVRENGFPTFNERQLKRYRAEKLVEAQVVHPGFGGTRTIYRPEAGERALMVCQLLKRRRDYDVVRFRLWLSGRPIELGLLKESIWCLVPFSSWQMPATAKERRFLAQKLADKILASAWTSVRSNLARKILQSFERHKDQLWFLHLHTQLLYGIKIEIKYDGLGIEELEEETDIFAYGLQTQEVRVFPAKGDLASHLQQLSNGQFLSFSKLRRVLFAATEEELILVLPVTSMKRPDTR